MISEGSPAHTPHEGRFDVNDFACGCTIAKHDNWLCSTNTQGARRASPYPPGQSDTLTSNVEVTPSQTLERYQGGPLGSSSDESDDEAFERGRAHRSLVLRRVSDFPSNTPQSMTSLHVYSFCVQNLYGVEILITLYVTLDTSLTALLWVLIICVCKHMHDLIFLFY